MGLSLPTALDQLLIKLFAQNGTPLPSRPYANLLGTGVSAVDNPNFTVNGDVVGSTDITIGPAVFIAPVRLNKNSSSLQLTSAMVGATILLDCTAGSFAPLLPASPQDGWWFRFKDPGNSGGTAGTWSGTSYPTITDATPRDIEDLVALGTFPTNSVSPKSAGQGFILEYDATNNRWFNR